MYFHTMKPGVPYVMSIRAICTTGGPVTIKSVRPYGAENMQVVAWGVRKRTAHTPWTSEDNGGGGEQSLPGDYPGFGHHPVTVPCGINPNGPRWAVEDMDVSTSFTGTRGTMRGVEITYGNGRVARSQFALALCSTKTCAPPPGIPS